LVTRTTALTAATFGILTLSTLTPAFAQDAKAILKKMIAAYGTPKSYQAEMVMDMNGPQGKSKMTILVKKSGEKMAMNMTSTGGAGPMGGNFNTVIDGKNLYIYMAAMNQYMKMPYDARTQAMIKSQSGTPDEMIKKIAKEGTFKRLADATVEGKSAYVLEAVQNKKPAEKAKLYIDKGTSRLVKLEGKGTGPGEMSNGGVVLVVRNEKINPSLPASTFVFTPPKGAKMMQNPMGGGAPR
jgi:outer membrane lipoprotein-sorting protein